MKKRSFQNQNLQYRYYRKFCNLRDRINKLMNTGEFYHMTREFQFRLLRRLKILYNRLTRLLGKQKVKWATAALAVIFSSLAAYAQFNDPVSLSGFYVEENSDPVFVDFDGDTDLDILIGDADGTLRYIKNEGGKWVPSLLDNPFTDIDLTDVNSSPAMMDVDGDGDLDLILGHYTSGVMNYFENDEGTFVEKTGADNPFNSTPVSWASNPAVADIDMDGDLDVLVGNYYGNLEFIRNDEGTFTKITGIDNPFDGMDFGGFATTSFTDYDGDGDMDLFVGNVLGNVYYVENDEGNFDVQSGPSNPFNAIDFGTFVSPAVLDVDGDDDMDLVLGDEEGMFLKYYRNDDEEYTEKRGTPNPFEGVKTISGAGLAFIDLDEDGDLDLTLGGGNGDMMYYENTEEGFIPRTGAENPFDAVAIASGYAMPAFGDMDGDGDLDLVIGDYDGNLNYYTNEVGDYIELTGTANPFDAVDVGYGAAPAVADLDEDGDMDLFVGSKYGGDNFGKVSYFRNVSGTFIEQTGVDNPFDNIYLNDSLGGANPTFANIDGDGDLDLYIGEKYGTGIVSYENNEGEFTQLDTLDNPFYDMYFGLTFSFAPAFADVDDDGDLDLYVATMDLYNGGNLYFVENTSAPVGPESLNRSLVADVEIFAHDRMITIDTRDNLLERIEVYSATGELIRSEQYRSIGREELNMTSARTGIYIVRVYTSEGLAVKKVIIR